MLAERAAFCLLLRCNFIAFAVSWLKRVFASRRLNQKPPAIKFRRKERGGLAITKGVKLTHCTDELIKNICK